MVQTFKVSERRACELLDQPRATQRRAMPDVDEDAALCATLLKLVQELPRLGRESQTRAPAVAVTGIVSRSNATGCKKACQWAIREC